MAAASAGKRERERERLDALGISNLPSVRAAKFFQLGVWQVADNCEPPGRPSSRLLRAQGEARAKATASKKEEEEEEEKKWRG